MNMLRPWLIGYIGTGVAVFFVYYLYNERPWKKGKKNHSAMRELIRNFDKKPLSDKLIDAFAILIGVALALGFWPAFVGMVEGEKLIQKIKKAKSKHKFSANKGNLRKLMDICEIEIAELVSDPLNAAPNLPFGHLNGGWESFKGKRIEGDEIWSFSAATAAESEPSEVWHDQFFEGYALLRKRKVVAEFYSHGN